MALIVALIVGTTYWQTWARPGLAARQDNEIQRVAEFQVRRGLILAPERVLARNRAAERRGQDALLPPVPPGEARRPRRRLLDRLAEPRGAREVAERDADGHRARARRPGRPPARRASAASRSSATPWPRRSTCARSRSRSTQLGRTCGAVVGARPAEREAPRDGLLAELRPEPRRETVRDDLRDHGRLPAGGAARQPRVAGPLPAGLDLQGRHARRRRSSRTASRPTRRSSTPATASPTASGSTTSTRAGRSGGCRLATALQYSVNSVFCNIGKALGAKRILDQAKQFGFYERPPLETPDGERYPSGLYRERRALVPEAQLGRRCGADGVRAGADARHAAPDGDGRGGIGNAGIVMRPYVVEKVRLAAGQDACRARGPSGSVAPSGRSTRATSRT